MPYALSDPLTKIKGVGDIVATNLAEAGLKTIQDLLLVIPLRYEDRSQLVTIGDLQPDQLVTLQATVKSSNSSYRGRRSMQRATVEDNYGKLKLMWFNTPFIVNTVKPGATILISGKLNDRGMMVQPKVEAAQIGESLHTGRIVPIYSASLPLPAGKLRRLIKEVTDHLELPDDLVQKTLVSLKSNLDSDLDSDPNSELLSLKETFSTAHFPDDEDHVKKALHRLALEELLGLIQISHQIKDRWHAFAKATVVKPQPPLIPDSIPFTLTTSQNRSTQEISAALQKKTPMNRLLIGDVGAGKTVVGGIAAQQTVLSGHHAALIAPTQILVQQHLTTLQKLFPNLPVMEVTARQKFSADNLTKPTLLVGTHALINKIKTIQPALIIFDEQHRFGVSQRSVLEPTADYQPHVLTMSATPIPRSLTLTIFAHLDVSFLTELPPGRQPTKTWLTPTSKRDGAYEWLESTLAKTDPHQPQNRKLAIVVCPFIEPSASERLAKVASVATKFEEITKRFPKHKIEILHGRQTAAQKQKVIDRLNHQDIDILVTTPIVEVGLDLPQADVMILEAAERFGLASLHQLRGRVGRAGQQGYCLLFTTSGNTDKERLKYFSSETDGLKVAEFDLQNRGSGSIFGTAQHGLSQLRFADWTNLELVSQARQAYDQLVKQKNWKPLFLPKIKNQKEKVLAAN